MFSWYFSSSILKNLDKSVRKLSLLYSSGNFTDLSYAKFEHLDLGKTIAKNLVSF